MRPNTIAQTAMSQTSLSAPPRATQRRLVSQTATIMPATMHSA